MEVKREIQIKRRDNESNAYCTIKYRRDDVVVRASASQSVNLGFISFVKSYQKACLPMGGCGEQAGKFACVFGQGT